MPADQPDLRPTWSRSDRAVPRVIVRPLQEFLSTSTAAGAVLLLAVVVALLWANLWPEAYEHVWHTPMVLRVGEQTVGTDLHFWIADGAMTFFFLVVGLEIKRELTIGELQRPRAAALPAIAAVGGMLLPAALFLLIAGSGPAQRGWGIPMATDIALALGALALAASAAPSGLKPLLLTLAIVDDIGAILVIAVFYSDAEPLIGLWCLGIIGLIWLAQRAHVRAVGVYVFLGVCLWYACLRTGIHPTIAGVVLGLLTPAYAFQRPAAVSDEARRVAAATVDEPDPPDADAGEWLQLATLSQQAVPPLARVEHLLLPWTSFVIVPLFALSTAGVTVSAETLRAVFAGALGLGILAGLVVGKPLGIWASSRLVIAARIGTKPDEVGWGDVAGMGAIAGIGFTVALFIAELAFPDDPLLLAEAKVAILVASVIAGIAGTVALRLSRSPGEGRSGAEPG